ncbi:hypothetical protein T01_14797 [Trichinella spiralis]|uniref:Uncharacterized protein n=1 Tax=Trichinella spiralis TaxID=6334 RepID=A0A0V1BCA9_TRISP|nr:hypothetical protein T01_14797 [Trichinella spiralis]
MAGGASPLEEICFLHPSAAIVLIENVIKATWFVSKVSSGFSKQAAIFPGSEQKRFALQLGFETNQQQWSYEKCAWENDDRHWLCLGIIIAVFTADDRYALHCSPFGQGRDCYEKKFPPKPPLIIYPLHPPPPSLLSIRLICTDGLGPASC